MIRGFQFCWYGMHEKVPFKSSNFWKSTFILIRLKSWFSTKAFVGFFFWSNLHYKQSLYDWLYLHKKRCLMEIHTSLNNTLSTLHQRIFIEIFKSAWEVKASPSRILFVFIDLSRYFTTTSILLRAQPNTAITKLGQKKKLFDII